jgi:hypothetical protein
VAVGNLDGGPSDAIITGADGGGGPQVNIYSAAQIRAGNFASPAVAFYAYPFANGLFFTGGVRVACGDVNGDGLDDLITTPGPGGGPQVNIYLGTANGGFLRGAGQAFPAPDLSFLGLGPGLAGYAGGLFATAIDANGDGFADLFVGAGSGSSEVTVFNGAQLFGPTPNVAPLTAFYAYYLNPASFAFASNPALRFTAANLTEQLTSSPVPVNGQNGGPILLSQPLPSFNFVDEFDARAIFNNPSVPPSPFGILDNSLDQSSSGPGGDS